MLVTSFAEVWIEIVSGGKFRLFSGSLPSRKCGLKLSGVPSSPPTPGHFLRGSVD